ncbi:MAG: hypothetical protein O8C64_11330 [Candidatus Methanoperedens sp.]|nr:hypothetical protein [Candidatus Methanoperedens sp.]
MLSKFFASFAPGMKNSIFMFIYEPQFIADSAVENPAPQSRQERKVSFKRNLTSKDFTTTFYFTDISSGEGKVELPLISGFLISSSALQE